MTSRYVQFKQQILPGGIWNTLNAPQRHSRHNGVELRSGGGPDATAVAPDPASQFNYPAYTVETMSNVPVGCPLDQRSRGCQPATTCRTCCPSTRRCTGPTRPMDCRMDPARTDCAGPDPDALHRPRAHRDPRARRARGAPQRRLPRGLVAARRDRLSRVRHQRDALRRRHRSTNPGDLGYADYSYRQDQPATTLWYHDHSLGMTRNNVYAGPAGFWLIRGGIYDKVMDTSTGPAGPCFRPAPAAGQERSGTQRTRATRSEARSARSRS